MFCILLGHYKLNSHKSAESFNSRVYHFSRINDFSFCPSKARDRGHPKAGS
jgi:hypothetical protein